MKLALLGKGKTGSEIIKLYKGDLTVFDRDNVPTTEKLRGHDVIISFLSSEPFFSYLDILLDSKIPLVCGTTGLSWPKDLDARLKGAGVSWVWSFNFSLGMYFVRSMLRQLNDAKKFMRDVKIGIHEIHHTSKLDAPSGTAISWNELLGNSASITYERVGDVMGHHELRLETDAEKITITHDAKNRGVFAEGALWAARYMTSQKTTPGLIHFDQILDRAINERGELHGA